MENEYDNKKLKKYFEANIRRMEINKEFKPLLVDIMMRRAIAFNLSLQEIYRDMLVLANNLTKIEVGQIPDDYEGNVTGLYYSNERKILISQEIVKKIIISENMENYEEVYDTLMHEVFHALAMDENGNNTISTINRYTNEVYTSLEEAIVSKAVDRCMHGRRVKEEENFPFFHQNKGAYTDITYITDLLEATYGVSEKAFLRHAIQGKKNLAEFLSSVSGESIDESLGYIDKIETNYSILHKTLYESGFEGKELEDRVKDSLIAGFLVSYWTMYRCIENLDVSDLDTFGYRIERFKFGYNKMGELLRHVTKDFDYRFRNNNVSSYIFDLIKGTQEEGGLKLNIISEILKNKEKIPNEDLVKMLNFAKMERKEKKAFEEEELFEKYGIELRAIGFVPLKKESYFMYEDADFKSVRWNNSKIINMCGVFRPEYYKFKLNQFFENVKKIFKKCVPNVFGKNETKQKMFGIGKDSEEQTTSNSTFGELSSEDLEKFNKGMNKMLESYKNSETIKKERSMKQSDDELDLEEQDDKE